MESKVNYGACVTTTEFKNLSAVQQYYKDGKYVCRTNDEGIDENKLLLSCPDDKNKVLQLLEVFGPMTFLKQTIKNDVSRPSFYTNNQ